MNQDKSDIYKFLDENGFKFHYSTPISLSFNFETLTPEFGPKMELHIDSPCFGFTTEDFEAIILDYIFDTTGIEIKSLKDITKYSTQNNLPFIIQVYRESDNSSTYTLAFGKVNGSLRISIDDKFESLGNIEEITNDLTFKESSVKSLGQLKKVGGSIYIRQFDPPFTNLESLDNLEFVGGNLILKGSPLKDLGKLKFVGGKLNLRKTNITSLGLLEYVGEDLFLPKSLKGIRDLERIIVLGNLKFFSN